MAEADRQPSGEYLTVTEAASILRLTRRTVYSLMKSGKLSAVKFGGSWRIPVTAVRQVHP